MAAGHDIAPLPILLDTCISAAWLYRPSSQKTGLHREAGSNSWWLKPRQMSLLLLQLGSMVAPGRGTEQPSGSRNAMDALAEPQSASGRAPSADEVVPLSLLGAAALARTSSPPSPRLTQPRPEADTHEGGTRGSCPRRGTPGFAELWCIPAVSTLPGCRGRACPAVFGGTLLHASAHPRCLSPDPAVLPLTGRRGGVPARARWGRSPGITQRCGRQPSPLPGVLGCHPHAPTRRASAAPQPGAPGLPQRPGGARGEWGGDAPLRTAVRFGAFCQAPASAGKGARARGEGGRGRAEEEASQKNK